MASQTLPTFVTLGELLDDLGGISPDRIRLRPPPGRAREKDLLHIHAHEDRLYELVDGVLVEKAMGAKSSLIGFLVGYWIQRYLDKHPLGVVLGADGTLRLRPGLVRIPDVSFISWDRIPGGEFPSRPIPHLAPDLAIEVLSESNTPGEMARKVGEYFEAGARLVWLIDPETRTAEVHSAPDQYRSLRIGQSLDGGDVLPGFTLPLRKLFAGTRRP